MERVIAFLLLLFGLPVFATNRRTSTDNIMMPTRAISLLICCSTLTFGSTASSAQQMAQTNGTVLFDNTPLCALVLVNGQSQFSCGGQGEFDIAAPLDANGLLAIQVFASGFAPLKETFPPSNAIGRIVRMERTSNGRPLSVRPVFEDAGANRARVSGTVRSGNQEVCALVLANGQKMFSCGANLGRFDLNVPLDSESKVTLQIFAAGFEPYSFVSFVGQIPPPPASCTSYSNPGIFPIGPSPYICGQIGTVTAAIMRDVNAFWGSQMFACSCSFDQPACRGNAVVYGNTPLDPGFGYIYYDPFLLEKMAVRAGTNLAAGYVMAHEAGHVIQAAYTVPYLAQSHKELAADCLSGYFLGSLACQDRIDTEALESTLVETCLLGEGTSAFFDPFSHGTCQERVASVIYGIVRYAQKVPPLTACR